MSYNILITSASGYLGGTLLAHLASVQDKFPAYGNLYARIRTEAQAESMKQYGAKPLTFDPRDGAEVRNNVVNLDIAVVYCLIDAGSFEAQTTGAKVFSSHSGASTDRPLLDSDPELYNIQKTQRSPHENAGGEPQIAVDANNTVIEEAEKYDGEGEGFGNKISIQTVGIVKAAKALQRVYKIDQGELSATSLIYLQLLREILAGEDVPHGKNGYYLASSGSIVWEKPYMAMAAALAKRNVVGDTTVVPALGNEDLQIVERMGAALGCPKEFVPVQLRGKYTFIAVHGKEIRWEPEFPPEHILEAADAEVELILKNL
ncbi:putative nad dependent epimerase dehydratase family protein [Mycena sanguinolenta]|uniref:Putative nad dependent epimerase dehydratase family protein n=1 Tax=Mycena sanguinolenta TaxID=230812 RepID=A0A8H6XWS4_9AGAR|nr:putative nad dependent epimerase dehydratase family protein [Mycena sanguinolenta]